MLSNQNINIKNSVSFSEQEVSQTPIIRSDSQTIDNILKELEAQETGQKKQNSPDIIDSLIEEVESMEQKEMQPDNGGLEKQDVAEKTTESQIKTESFNGVKPAFTSPKPCLPAGRLWAEEGAAESSGVTKPAVAESFGAIKEKFFDPLKNAKFEYERLGQSEDEKKMVGAQAIETYLHWVEESRKLLRENLSDREKEKISIFIPKRIQKQLEDGTAPAESVLENKKESSSDESSGKVKPVAAKSFGEAKPSSAKGYGEAKEESALHERVHRIEKKINDLDQDRSEYPEELLPLATKKVLVEEEIRNKADESMPADGQDLNDNERLEQERSTQNILDKSSFENKAPVVRPEKEEWERLEKAQLAEKIEKDKDEKKREDTPEQKETAINKKEEVKEETEKEEKISEKPSSAQSLPAGRQGYGETKKEAVPVYTDEQLHTATKIRLEFHKKLSSINRAEWYQGPSKNRDLVNKQIIQVTGILSGKESAEIDMNDIQTARIFMFNNAPQKILKHPAFSYVESFYNYQSSQGCVGINPEEVFLEQKNLGSERSSGTEKGRSFMEQLSTQKNGEVSNTDTEGRSEEIKKDDLSEDTLLE